MILFTLDYDLLIVNPHRMRTDPLIFRGRSHIIRAESGGQEFLILNRSANFMPFKIQQDGIRKNIETMSLLSPWNREGQERHLIRRSELILPGILVYHMA